MKNGRVIRSGEQVDLAAEGLAAFVSDYEKEPAADVVNRYLCGGFADLCCAFNGLREDASDAASHEMARRMSNMLMDLDACVVRCHRHYGKVPRRSFRRTASVVASVFKPNAFPAGRIPAIMKGKMTPEQYRARVIDRVAEVVRNSFVWLRDVTRDFELMEGK